MGSDISERSGRRIQYAALPYRVRRDGTVEVRLITSRETRRWVIPKGWPMKGMTPAKAAARETYEEAGLLGTVAREPLGLYTYDKRLANRTVPCDVIVFPLKVKRRVRNWPERSQRFGFWFPIESAAAAVQEEDLKVLILAFGDIMAQKRAEKHGAAGDQAAAEAPALPAVAEKRLAKKPRAAGEAERAAPAGKKGGPEAEAAGMAEHEAARSGSGKSGALEAGMPSSDGAALEAAPKTLDRKKNKAAKAGGRKDASAKVAKPPGKEKAGKAQKAARATATRPEAAKDTAAKPARPVPAKPLAKGRANPGKDGAKPVAKSASKGSAKGTLSAPGKRAKAPMKGRAARVGAQLVAEPPKVARTQKASASLASKPLPKSGAKAAKATGTARIGQAAKVAKGAKGAKSAAKGAKSAAKGAKSAAKGANSAAKSVKPGGAASTKPGPARAAKKPAATPKDRLPGKAPPFLH